MAKTNSKVTKKVTRKLPLLKKASKVVEKVVPVEEASADQASEADLSSDDDDDEDLEVGGFSDDEGNKASGTGHYVNKNLKSAASVAAEPSKVKRAVIYIGRIPHGFYEDEMRRYFKQFGDILRLRVARNKETGKSKHFGFVEFKEMEAAKAAVTAMNNYLLFEKILKVEIVENPHENLFHSTNRGYFKAVDRIKIRANKHNGPKSREDWDALHKALEDTKSKKREELKNLGFDYTF